MKAPRGEKHAGAYEYGIVTTVEATWVAHLYTLITWEHLVGIRNVCLHVAQIWQ